MIKQTLVLLSFLVSVLALSVLLPQVIAGRTYANIKSQHFNETSISLEEALNGINLMKNSENETFIDGINTLTANQTNQTNTSNITITNLTSDPNKITTISKMEPSKTAMIPTSGPNIPTSEPNIPTSEPNSTTFEPNSTTFKPNITTFEPNITTFEPNITSTTHSSPHPLPGWSLALILTGVTVAIIIFTFIIFIRYRRSKIPLAQPVHSLMNHINRKSTVNRSSRPIPVSSFSTIYRTKFLDETFLKEFHEIQDYSADLNLKKTRDVGKREENRTRNRFVDIIPFDDNYVTLSSRVGNPPSNYINASYVEGLPQVGKFIVTQGPKQNTVVEFWKMIVEKQCRTIIMLTNLQEAGRVKCFQYWPPSGQMLHFDDISLFTTEETDVHSGTMARKIEVSMEDDPESDVFCVRQLHLTNWPDHGVPETTNSLLAFLRVSRDFLDQGTAVIHCSAGVGRTGTYLALLTLTEQIRNGAESLDVFSTVKSLRESRSKMVQTEEQYVFLHQAISDFIKTGEGAAVVPGDDVLDDGVDNFGFEHVRL